MPRRIDFLIFPGFQVLDAAGPIAAFEIAERCRPGSYGRNVVAVRAGGIASTSGAAMQAEAARRPRGIDTLVVAGGDGSRAAATDERTLRFVRAAAASARRVASVCSGSYVLAAAGLLDGRKATTHWSCAEDFARRFPRVRVDSDRIFVKADRIWTSAGITAGIDLSLALIAEDLGEELARRTARQLVVYYRRPGGQSQFSALLQMGRAEGRFASLLDHVRSHLRDRLDVDALAALACMSPRHFTRAFKAETGVTPAKAVERLRAEAARAALESGAGSVGQVAAACGFADTERMRRSFLRLFGLSPAALKRVARAAEA